VILLPQVGKGSKINQLKFYLKVRTADRGCGETKTEERHQGTKTKPEICLVIKR
jgi:hypothetical protein